jgi:UDP-glucose:(glucosyl)LPS alpha-1,2-glucosyltransferase
MPIATDELSANAMGGSEIMKYGLRDRLGEDFIEPYQIIMSRARELDPTKHRVFWLQDLPEDPESEHLKSEGWRKYHKIVYNSNWQMARYQAKYNIPFSRSTVLLNAIDPIPVNIGARQTEKIKLIYTSTPHRGLEILVPVFAKLCEKYDNIELDVFSSFKIYGWEQRDDQYKDLFDACKNHPKINYHGSVPNAQIREALCESHIFAYPSIWLETSCIALMEAMSAGLLCVHPNYGALPETAANWTNMYNWHEDLNTHAQIFYNVLDVSIQSVIDKTQTNKLVHQKNYVDAFYSWAPRLVEWRSLLESIKHTPVDIEQPKKEMFVYKVG